MDTSNKTKTKTKTKTPRTSKAIAHRAHPSMKQLQRHKDATAGQYDQPPWSTSDFGLRTSGQVVLSPVKLNLGEFDYSNFHNAADISDCGIDEQKCLDDSIYWPLSLSLMVLTFYVLFPTTMRCSKGPSTTFHLYMLHALESLTVSVRLSPLLFDLGVSSFDPSSDDCRGKSPNSFLPYPGSWDEDVNAMSVSVVSVDDIIDDDDGKRI